MGHIFSTVCSTRPSRQPRSPGCRRLLRFRPGIRQIGARDAQAVLKRPLIERDQQLARLHFVALAEMNLRNDTIDLRFD